MSFTKWKAVKDPQDVKDYDLDWAARLVGGETLTNAVWSIPKKPTTDATNPLTIGGATSFAGSGLAKVWLSGGVKGTYNLLCHVTTSLSRQYDKTMVLTVGDQ